jgi:hypothetical protein
VKASSNKLFEGLSNFYEGIVETNGKLQSQQPETGKRFQIRTTECEAGMLTTMQWWYGLINLHNM